MNGPHPFPVKRGEATSQALSQVRLILGGALGLPAGGDMCSPALTPKLLQGSVLGGSPSAKSPCFLCPWSGQRTQACTTLIQMSVGRQATAHPLRPGLLLHPFIQPAGSLLSSDWADAPCPPCLHPGCSLCQDCCSPHMTPPLTAFSLCFARPPRPLTCFCDLMSQHLQRLGFFFSCC